MAVTYYVALPFIRTDDGTAPGEASDFVDVMSQSDNYVDRVVLSSPVHRHKLILVLFSEHA